MNIRELLLEKMERTGKGDTAIVGWGRGMGHKGHMYLASSVITHANQLGGDPYFVVSRTVGKDDPITPEEKLAIYKKVFPKQGHIFQTASDEMPDLTRVLGNLNQQGYRNAVVIVGADQVKAFQYLKQYNGKPDKSGNVAFNFDNLDVISRQETSDPSRGEEGPRATPMRQVLLDPSKSEQEQFAVWRDAMNPEISDDEVRNLMNKAKERMISMQPAPKKAPAKKAVDKKPLAVAEEGPKNALGKALYRDLSKEKKASPAQVEKNKARWVQRQKEREQDVKEADKHSFIGRIKRHNELKNKVDQTWKDIGDAQKRGDKNAAGRSFEKHVKYTNLERPGTWTKVKEETPGYIKYEQMKDRIAGVLIKLYDQGKDLETIKQMGGRIAKHLGYDPEDSIFQDAFLSSFTDASLDGAFDKDDEEDYTDYSMRQGERGNPDRMREDTDEQRKVTRLRAMIADYEKRAKMTSNDIKKQHYMQMASQLREKLPTNDVGEGFGKKSDAMAHTAKRLTDPKDGKVAKLRASGDKRREDELKYRDIAQRNEFVDLKTSLQELSNELLSNYKKAAGADASKADKAGDFKRGDKRFSGIVKATNKQFSNDMKKHKK